MAGYTRQSTSDIIDGNEIDAGPLADEFNAIEGAFNSVVGHAHDASTGNGPKINLTTSVTAVLPVANGGTGAANLNAIVQTAGAQTITGLKSIQVGNATTSQSFLEFQPIDYTTGKPKLAIQKSATATQWNLLLFDGTNNAGTINFVSTGLTWNSNQLADLVTTQTFSGLKTVSLNTATTSSDYFRFSPTDTGTGKPYLAVNKSATAAQWNISLWDGTNSAGTINFGASTGLTWNGNQIADLSTSQTFTNKTYSGGTFAGTTGGNLTLSGLANIAINTATTAQDYIHFTPTDVGTGKPYLAVGKGTTAAQWNIGLFDGTNSAGIINFSCGTSLNWNGVQLVDLSTSQTLTNKTITRPTITLQDSTTTFQDDGDNTKQFKFQASGISTATTRTYTVPNFDATLATLAGSETLTNKTIIGASIDTTTVGVTQTGTDNSTKLATTAFVQGLVGPASLVKISATTISGNPSSIVFSNLASSGYVKYILILEDVVGTNSSTNDGVSLHVSTDNGSTYKTTSGDYYTTVPAAKTFLCNFGIPGNTSTYKHGYTEVHIYGLGNSSRATTAKTTASNYWTSATGNTDGGAQDCSRSVAEADNALRLVSAFGANFASGVVTLYGVKS